MDVGSFGSHFESVSDPRHTRNRKHLLVDIVVISICGIICGASGPTTIHRWAKSKQAWLAKYLSLANGIPSRDSLRRLLMALQPEAFQKCFEEWIASGVEAEATGVCHDDETVVFEFAEPAADAVAVRPAADLLLRVSL